MRKVKKITLLLIMFLAVILIKFCIVSASNNIMAYQSLPHTDTQVKLEWNSVADAVYYNVFRNGTKITSININVDRNYLDYQDKGLSPATKYDYSLACTDANGGILDFSSVNVATSSMIKPVVGNVLYDINTKQIKVDLSISSYASTNLRVYKTDNISVGVKSSTGSSCVFTDYTLTDNIISQYKVVCKDDLGNNSVESDLFSILPLSTPQIQLSLEKQEASITWGTYANINIFSLQRARYNGSSGWEEWENLIERIKSDANGFKDKISSEYSYRYRLKVNTNNYIGYSNITKPISLPKAPSNLSCTLVEFNKINLLWENNENVQSPLRIERKINNGDFSTLAILSGNVESYSDTINIEAQKTYTYRIAALGENNNISISSEASVSTDIPSSPLNLTLNIVSTTRIDLNWKDNSNNESGFKVERKIASGDFAEVGSLQKDVTTYSDIDVVASTLYTYRVTSYSFLGKSQGYSNQVSTSTDVLKAPPSSLTITPISTSQIKLAFTYTTKPDFGTEIERKGDANNAIWETVGTVGSDANAFIDKGLKANSNYFYRTRGILGANVYTQVYPDSNGISKYTLMDKPIALLAKWTSSSKVLISWKDTLDEEMFEIQKKADNSTFYTVSTVASDANSWLDSEVSSDKTYTYRIRAKSTNNYSEYSDEVTVTIPSMQAPNFTKYIVIDGTNVILEWENKLDDASTYTIERKLYDSDKWDIISTITSDMSNYIDCKISLNCEYFYRIKMYNSAFDVTNYSDEFYVYSQEIKSPSELTLSCTLATKINLSWKDNSNNEDGFIILRQGKDKQFFEISRVDSDVETFIDSNLSSSTIYTYRVKAYNVYAESKSSNDFTINTCDSITFDDMNDAKWATEAVTYLADRGIVKGLTGNNKIFKPNDNITRSEFVSYIVKAFDLPEKPVGKFSDVDASNLYYKDIMTAKQMRIISGSSDNRFFPNQPITRQDMAVVIVKALKSVEIEFKSRDTSSVSIFEDADKISNYAISAIAILVSENIISGKSKSMVAPKDFATKAEAASIVYKVFNKFLQKNTGSD